MSSSSNRQAARDFGMSMSFSPSRAIPTATWNFQLSLRDPEFCNSRNKAYRKLESKWKCICEKPSKSQTSRSISPAQRAFFMLKCTHSSLLCNCPKDIFQHQDENAISQVLRVGYTLFFRLSLERTTPVTRQEQ